jgi:anthranilate phosphoribosyltransferase
VTAAEWQPADFGLEPCRRDELQAADPEASAAVIRGVLDDCPGPARRIVVANAAAALLAARRVPTLRDGVGAADAAIRDGRARQVFARLSECS